MRGVATRTFWDVARKIAYNQSRKTCSHPGVHAKSARFRSQNRAARRGRRRSVCLFRGVGRRRSRARRHRAGAYQRRHHRRDAFLAQCLRAAGALTIQRPTPAFSCPCRFEIADLSRRARGRLHDRTASDPDTIPARRANPARRRDLLLRLLVRHHVSARPQQPARPERSVEFRDRPIFSAACRTTRLSHHRHAELHRRGGAARRNRLSSPRQSLRQRSHRPDRRQTGRDPQICRRRADRDLAARSRRHGRALRQRLFRRRSAHG